MEYAIPIFAVVIGLIAGVLNLFIAFVMKAVWAEIKSTQLKLDADVNNIYKEIRTTRKDLSNEIDKVDQNLMRHLSQVHNV